MPPHIRKTKESNYVIIIVFPITMLMEVQYSLSKQIQDLHIGNNRGVNEDYCVLGCETTQLANVLDHRVPPSSRSQGSDSWWAPCSSQGWEGSSPVTAVSPLMPPTSCQQTAPHLIMLSNCHTKTILSVMVASYGFMCDALVRHGVDHTILRWIGATLEGRTAVATLNVSSMRIVVSRGCPQVCCGCFCGALLLML